jgi:hypothetical protein
VNNKSNFYRGGMNAGVWAGVFSGVPSEPSHANPAMLNNPEWRRGYVDGNAGYFVRLREVESAKRIY